MEIRRLFFFFIVLSMLTSCEKDYYTASPIDPRLPALTADGENAAGAYIDGYAWKVNQAALIHHDYFSISTNTDSEETLMLISHGYQVIESKLVRRDVGFYLGNLPIYSKHQLLEMKDTVIDLDGVSNYGILITELLVSDTLRNGEGKLHIRDVIWNPNTETIFLSGTFGFDFKSDDAITTVYSGRFDFRVHDSNFHYRF